MTARAALGTCMALAPQYCARARVPLKVCVLLECEGVGRTRARVGQMVGLALVIAAGAVGCEDSGDDEAASAPDAGAPESSDAIGPVVLPVVQLEVTGGFEGLAPGVLRQVTARTEDAAHTIAGLRFVEWSMDCEDGAPRCPIDEELGPFQLTLAEARQIEALVDRIPAGECVERDTRGCDPQYLTTLRIADRELPFGPCSRETCAGLDSIEQLAALLRCLVAPEDTSREEADCLSRDFI